MKKLAFTFAVLLATAPNAFAGNTFEPIAGNGAQKVSAQTLSESADRMSVSLTYTGQLPQVTVFHPNGGGKLSDNFSPYDFRNIVNTNVFLLQINNEGGETVGADDLMIQVSLNGLPYEYLSTKDLMQSWRDYYYLNTNTVTGAPNFMEQERAIAAEKYLTKHGFQAKDIPPGGSVTGYIAVPYLKEAGALKFRVRNMGDRKHSRDFVFRFNAKNS